MDETTRKYIEVHLNDDINKLALSKFPVDIDKQFVMRQIQARQLLKKKLPSWSENDELLFPKRLSLEQCSSELTAKYKVFLTANERECTRKDMGDGLTANERECTRKDMGDGLTANECECMWKDVRVNSRRLAVLVDLTGGMGVDTSFLSDSFDETIYVEAQEELCELARHNFKILNKDITVVNAKAEDFLSRCDEVDCIYLDPARRDEYGRKMVSLHDCSPDVAELQELLFKKAKTIIVKLSPMLDIDIIKKELKNIKEIHVVAVKNECKELLVKCQRTTDNRQQTSCTNVETSLYGVSCTAIDLRENWNFTFTENEEQNAVVSFADEIGKYLYEPGVACMKAAPFKLLSQRFNIKKLHRNSHLYTSDELVVDFPGRIFEVMNVVPFDKKTRKTLTQTLKLSESSQLMARSSQPKVSIAVRNFPLSADELRKHLSFKDGDDFYLFGTTMKGDKKVLVLGTRS